MDLVKEYENFKNLPDKNIRKELIVRNKETIKRTFPNQNGSI